VTQRNDLILELTRHYVWWVEEGGPSEDQVIAQIMNLGTYADIRRLERVFDVEELRAVMLRAKPGWFNERSWDFWRGRLRSGGSGMIPETPPQRSFHAKVL
jgi:hypothetical protein